jgi:glycerophosphoryl diester phosphodiesterase
VVPWTVNGRRAVRRCADLGVDGVITDAPVSAACALLHRSVA